jgi:putative flippase GtrA
MTEEMHLLLKRELPRFLIVGFSAVAVDFFTYSLLISFLAYAPAKAVSFISGTIVAYLFNKYWTFEKRDQNHFEMVSFVTLYAITLLINVGVNEFVLHIFPESIGFAFLLATATSTILNFIGMKWWVFRSKSNA